ncbi:MAG: hypothetical protein ABL897_09275, partial [Hyphomicrobium sp.]
MKVRQLMSGLVTSRRASGSLLRAKFKLGLAATVAVLALTGPTAAMDAATPDWPCIWRKVIEIDSATIWDGPAIDDAKKAWLNDDAVRKLSAYV